MFVLGHQYRQAGYDAALLKSDGKFRAEAFVNTASPVMRSCWPGCSGRRRARSPRRRSSILGPASVASAVIERTISGGRLLRVVARNRGDPPVNRVHAAHGCLRSSCVQYKEGGGLRVGLGPSSRSPTRVNLVSSQISGPCRYWQAYTAVTRSFHAVCKVGHGDLHRWPSSAAH